MSDRDLDAEFARIIAGWDHEAPEPQRRDPTAPADLGPELDADPHADLDTDLDTDVDSEVSAPTSWPDDPDGPGETASSTEREVAGSPDAPTAAATTPAPVLPTGPQAPPNPASPPTPTSPAERLELPIAPTTSHVWRASPPRRDDADAVLDGDDHFVPPSEIDLPSAENDPMFWAIVGGLVGGPLLLLYLLFFDRDGSGWWVATALAMVVVGFVLLVLRGGTERDPTDDGTRI